MPRHTAPTKTDGKDPKLVEIGDRLRKARHITGLEQKEVAQLVGVVEKTVSNWENGMFSPYQKVSELSAALGVSETWIMNGTSALDENQLTRILEAHTRLMEAILDELRLIRLDRRDRERRLAPAPQPYS